MRTIYEKEALFENLDAAFAELKEYIVSAVNKEELHAVEQQMFGRLQHMGRQGLEAFVTLSGTGYEAGNPVRSEDGAPLAYKGIALCVHFWRNPDPPRGLCRSGRGPGLSA